MNICNIVRLIILVCCASSISAIENGILSSGCLINGTVAGRMSLEGCVVCQAGEYFSRIYNTCKPCDGFFTNSEENIHFNCIEEIGIAEEIDENENATTIDSSNNTTDQSTTSEAVTTTVILNTEVATVNPTEISVTVMDKPQISCSERFCNMKLENDQSALQKMMNASLDLYDHYRDTVFGTNKLTLRGLSDFVTALGLRSTFIQDILLSMKKNVSDINTTQNTSVCISSYSLFLKEYFVNRRVLSESDFMVILPRIVLDAINPQCKAEEEEEDDHDHAHGDMDEQEGGEEKSSYIVWLVAFGSVFVISVLSVIGILLVPVMRHSIFYNRMISFLVALAVGTLIGDALLHLLPHATGIHDHGGDSDHNHGEEEEVSEDDFNMVWKGLVAVFGIYIFYLVETMMVIIRDIKQKRKMKQKLHGHDNKHEKDDLSPAIKDNRSISPLIDSKSSGIIKYEVGANGDGEVQRLVHMELLKDEDTGIHDQGCHKNRLQISSESIIEDGPHVHVEGAGAHIHNHMHSHEVPQGIANLAWMVVMGDGLHNFSDGLAIGAAFTSSIGAGLSTSIAVFCHELPHELGDFAILINAGMSVKQALLYNFLCACLAFLGLVIGMIIGEYTNTYKLWILAFTAGGFLYIALVDMIPQMLVSLREKDATVRFISQNIGLLIGTSLMLLIALREHSFEKLFAS